MRKEDKRALLLLGSIVGAVFLARYVAKVRSESALAHIFKVPVEVLRP